MLMYIYHYCLIFFVPGYLPVEFMQTAIVPKIKSETGNLIVIKILIDQLPYKIQDTRYKTLFKLGMVI